MSDATVQELCERGQRQLMEMRYLEAEATLARAEQQAFHSRNWDALARLYLPLQETRRQRRQCCGEGVVCLDLIAEGPTDKVDARHVVERYPHGQLLVAGWGTIEPAIAVRNLATRFGLYLDTFLGAVYPTSAGRAIVIVPCDDVRLPEPTQRPLDRLRAELPPHCLVVDESELPRRAAKGTHETYGTVMAMWERLHAPFLAAADALQRPMEKIEAFRKTIQVDYACELAHQKLSDVARGLATAPADRQSHSGRVSDR